MISLDGKKFRSVANTDNGQVNASTLFSYRQKGKFVWGKYKGGLIKKGQILGYWTDGGLLHFSYHHLDISGQLRTGTCTSTPEILPSGKLRMHEKWQWTTGDRTSGESVIEEV